MESHDVEMTVLDASDGSKEGDELLPSPLDSCSFISILFVSFLNPLLRLGSKRTLVLNDIPALPVSEGIEVSAAAFESYWQARKKAGDKTFLYAAWKTFGWRVVISGILIALQYAMLMVQPVFVRSFVKFLDEDSSDLKRGIPIALGLVATLILSSVCINQAFFQSIRAGTALRATLMHTIFLKSLRLSHSHKISIGETVTLMSNDARRFFELILFCNLLWLGPLVILVAMGLLFVEVGVASFAGLFLMLLMAPIQAVIASFISKLRRRMLKETDKRVKLTGEALRGIRIIKMYAWEKPLSDMINKIRNLEIVHLGHFLLLHALTLSLLFVWPIFVSAVVFITYVQLGNELTLVTTFSVFAILNSIRFPITLVPVAVHAISEAKVALGRINAFLLLPEIENYLQPGTNPGQVLINHCNFSWSREGPVVLRDVSMDILPGSLIAVVGSVGSGKSSLLSAIMGEMILDSGSISVCGRVSYMSELNWIRNQTVRDNILFGSSFDNAKYKECIRAAALEADLAILPDGDSTEIGERGINLSGGQKARVSLARALYRKQESDLFLLDDPFSAVDMSVGRQMFEQGVVEALEGKTRILALNSHLHFLKQVDRIVVFSSESESSIAGVFSNYEEMANAFPSLVHEDASQDEEEEEAAADDHLTELAVEPENETIDESVAVDHKSVPEKAQKLVQAEDREVGSVDRKVYTSYLKFASPNHYIAVFIGILLLYTIAQVCRIGADLWVSLWGSDSPLSDQPSSFWILIYLAWAVAAAFFAGVRSLLFATTSVTAAKNLHNTLFESMLKAPISTFYDVTPLGRIVNRFSKDLDTVDIILPDFLGQLMQYMFILFGSVAVACAGTPYFVLLLIPIVVVFSYVQLFFRRTSRETKRLDGISSSPVFSSFEETLSGIDTVRAFGVQNDFIKKMNEVLAEHSKCFLLNNLLSRWLGLRLDLLSAIFIGATAILPISIGNVDKISVSLALTYSMLFVGVLQYSVRISVEVESAMTSVERLASYGAIESEAPYHIDDTEPESHWPQSGAIEIKDLSLRYRKDLPLVLKKVSASIQPAEKIGICGRTGAGKSSIALALLRMVEPESSSSIVIDGVDICSIGLGTLRRRIAVIPQDATLFSGSVRYNLDPFEEHPDSRIWDVLRNVHLEETVRAFPEALQHIVSENGRNFSFGQRQLICIARAFLKDSRIIILDEATAGIDGKTDQLIQSMIRTLFRDRTVITIAHRLHTIIDYDRIMVLSEGEVLELGSPRDLLSDESSAFYEMIASSGSPQAVEQLIRLAHGQQV